MPREIGYKDAGDRVIVVNRVAFGIHGTVYINDGFGEVVVDLDDGRTFQGYEERDLIYEDEELPEEEVFEETGEEPEIRFLIGPDGELKRIGQHLGGVIYD